MKKKLNMYKEGTKEVPTEKKWNASGVDSSGKSLRAQGIYPEGEKPVTPMSNEQKYPELEATRAKVRALNEKIKMENQAQTKALPPDLPDSEWQKPSTLSSDMNMSVSKPEVKSIMGKVAIPKTDKAMMIQELLINQGFKVNADGRYGEETDTAFRKFMRKGESPDQALARLHATKDTKSIMYSNVTPLGKTPTLTGNG